MMIKQLMAVAALAVATFSITTCTEKKFHVEGNITEAKDSTLYFENMSLNGAVVLDSVKLGEDGAFSFAAKAGDAAAVAAYEAAAAQLDAETETAEKAAAAAKAAAEKAYADTYAEVEAAQK